MNTSYDQILEYVQGLEIIDTHEHLPSNETLWLKEREGRYDVFKEYLSHYLSADLVSAGLPLESLAHVRESDLPVQRKWNMVEPYWEAARYTGYGRALDLSVKGIYGIDRISGKTIEKVNEAYLASLRPGHFQRVLGDLSHIKFSVLDAFDGGIDEIDKRFKPVYRMDDFVRPGSYEKVKEYEKLTASPVNSLDAWCDCCSKTLDLMLEKGVVALKCGLAYERTLRFEKPTRATARTEFDDFLKGAAKAPAMDAQNYMMHHILDLANQRGLVYQFHTGLQEGFGNHVNWTDPSLMSGLFLDYPHVKFDIFHIAYPFQQKLSALSKNFANVFIDMCWAHIISPTASIAALTEYLDAVPYNKISAFGGDYLFPDGVYGHQLLARENVSKALARKVGEDVFDVSKAKEIARALFYDNPARLYT